MMLNKYMLLIGLLILLGMGTCASRTAAADTLLAEQFGTDVFETCPNLVENSGFEEGLAYWDPFQYPSGWTSSFDNPHSGSQCARFNFPGGAGYYDACMKNSGYQIHVKADVPYLLSFWIREKDTHDTYNTDITILDAVVNLNGISYGNPSPPPSESWQFVSTTVTFPESGYAEVHFSLHGYATSDLADFAVDDITLQECDCGNWIRSDSSVWVDTTNGWLHLGQDYTYDDWAEKAVSFSLPLRVETRMKLVSGGYGYRLPNLHIFYGTDLQDEIEIGYVTGNEYGWQFSGYTQVHTMSPESEDVWRTVSVIIRSDGGELLARSDSDTAFTFIAAVNWSISDSVVRIRYQQPWDAVCDIDYVLVEEWEGFSCSLSAGSSSTCLNQQSMMIPIKVANEDTISGMTVPLRFDTHCPGFAIDSVVFGGTRIQDWEYKNVDIRSDTVILALVADMGGGTPCLPPGEGPIAFIYFNVECSPENVNDTCCIYVDTCTFQPDDQGLLFVDSDALAYVPYFESGTTCVAQYKPGDTNGDCTRNLADAIYLLNYLFRNGLEPRPLDAGDVNGDCAINIGDPVYLLNYLFKGGPPPVCGCASHPESVGCCPNTADWSGFAKSAGEAELGLVAGIDDEMNSLEITGSLGTDVAGVQLEISYDPDKVTSIVPVLTERTNTLQLFSSARDGVLKLGIVDLAAKNLIRAGDGPLVRLDIVGGDLSCVEIKRAVVVDEHAKPLNVRILPKSEAQAARPATFSLHQNHPNPFNPETDISYSIPAEGRVGLSIYNIRGRKVKTLVESNQAAGHHTVHWDGTDEQGGKVASGIYFYRIQAGEFEDSKKMILMK
jgi:hypothetical protein